MQRFKDKNVLITGAASGMGRATAKRISEEGGNLALLDLNVDGLKTVSEELTNNGNKIVYAQCDVTNFEETGKVINKLANDLGGIHALSHNAGILRSYVTHEMTFEQWNEIININVNGTFNVNRHALPHLLKNERSYLVNNASNALIQTNFWIAAYVASKGAVNAFTRAIAMEYCVQGLHANSVLPGYIKSDMHSGFKVPENAHPKLARLVPPIEVLNFASPDEVASVIALLLCDDGRHINATSVVVDGGPIFQMI